MCAVLLNPKQLRTSPARSRTNTAANACDIGASDTAKASLMPSAPKPESGSRKAPKPKTCKVCKAKFIPFRSTQPTCGSVPCGVEYGLRVVAKAKAAKARKEATALREAKVAAKPRDKWLKEAQAAFNRFVRLRDADRPCISCGTTIAKWDAGHYRSVGSNPALRFEPLNNHKQCAQCNQHKSGNAIEYRIGLIARIGLEAVEWLEGPHDPKHYTIDDLRAIKATYAAKCRELEAK